MKNHFLNFSLKSSLFMFALMALSYTPTFSNDDIIAGTTGGVGILGVLTTGLYGVSKSKSNGKTKKQIPIEEAQKILKQQQKNKEVEILKQNAHSNSRGPGHFAL